MNNAPIRDTYRRGLLMNIASAMGGSQLESFSYGYDALNRPLVRNSDAFGYNERGEVVVSRNHLRQGYGGQGDAESAEDFYTYLPVTPA